MHEDDIKRIKRIKGEDRGRDYDPYDWSVPRPDWGQVARMACVIGGYIAALVLIIACLP